MIRSNKVTLNDKFLLERGRFYMTGIQALVRLPLDQMRLDRRAGLRTGAFISGYEGSPLGGYDLALARIKSLLDSHNIHLWPAVNEDLAATAILGSQIHRSVGPGRVDGAVGIWYGKGPGLDRSHDALRHANLAGCPDASAALVLAGDDHASKSSTIPHQSDFSLMNLGMPVLVPGSAQEVLDLGLAAIAMSRYSGSWTGLKLVTNVCDGGGTVDADLDRVSFVQPAGYQKYHDPMLVIPNTLRLEPETNLRRLTAAKEFSRANGLNRVLGNPRARIGIATAGKPYFDLVEALRLLGEPDVRILKFGMTFPIDEVFLKEAVADLDVLLVVEEKRSFLEMQIRDALYNEAARPLIHGKDKLPPYGEFDPEMIARALAPLTGQPDRKPVLSVKSGPWRPPNFCSGCPHNRSTILLEGQAAGGGTGCHGMAVMLSGAGRGFSFATHMGGEGAPWIGMAPFSERRHVFQNIGDGTFFHSGSLAVQACVAAKVNITFRLLYNGHVAMTGGQDATGALAVPELTRKLEAEGVKKIVVLVEDVERYSEHRARFAPSADIRDRQDLEIVLKDLGQTPGVTVLIYDQECAAEKRRKRSRGKMAEPTKRLVIHQEVCEGCGDCMRQSNCASLQKVKTWVGEKMTIHQSSCNKDYTCAFGDCPSFLTFHDAPKIEKRRGWPQPPAIEPPAKTAPFRNGRYSVVMPGIGGTGVVTINAILATAAMLDGLFVTSLDQTGLAQKGGAVTSHLTLSPQPMESAARVTDPDLGLGFDPNGLDSSWPITVRNTALPGPLNCDAGRLAEAIFGSHLVVNMLLTGFAWQAGLIPISMSAIEQAIEWNGVEAEMNRAAFHWGRAVMAGQSVPGAGPAEPQPFDPVAELTAYQNAAYAGQYETFVQGVPAELRDAVGRGLYKLMAYKDEYEVARLLTKPGLEGATYNLHPPMLRAFGLKRKIELGPWFRPFLQLLASMKFLRGTPLDPFGWMRHRREERELIGWYRDAVRQAIGKPYAAEIAALPQSIRGFDEIKSRSITAARRRAEELCKQQPVPSSR